MKESNTKHIVLNIKEVVKLLLKENILYFFYFFFKKLKLQITSLINLKLLKLLLELFVNFMKKIYYEPYNDIKKGKLSEQIFVFSSKDTNIETPKPLKIMKLFNYMIKINGFLLIHTLKKQNKRMLKEYLNQI